MFPCCSVDFICFNLCCFAAAIGLLVILSMVGSFVAHDNNMPVGMIENRVLLQQQLYKGRMIGSF